MSFERWSIFLILSLLLPASVFSQSKDVAVTIYNDNLALVREVREIDLQQGRSEISFQDVAAQIDPTSVYFLSKTAEDKVTILEQNFEYDLVNSSKILDKYIDKTVNFKANEGDTYSGTLLSTAGQDVVLREEDGKLQIVAKQNIRNMSFPDLPEGLITRPTLVWSVDCQKPGKHETEVSYLTGGIQWHAEYVGVTNSDDSELDIAAWVSIDNKSGATYKNAKVKLVAGEVNRAQENIRRRPVSESFALQSAVAPDGFQEKSFFEYHLYTLGRPSTIADNQTKQISLFPSTQIDVKKKYVFESYKNPQRVQVKLEFQNKKESGLGIPLPEGKFRVYKEDDDKSLIFVGEDFVEHTPDGEDISIHVGDAFDIVAERVQTVRNQLGKSSWEENWQIKLRNRKDNAVDVTVLERVNFDWEILRKSHDFTAKDARTIQFSVSIPKKAEVVVEYLVRYTR